MFCMYTKPPFFQGGFYLGGKTVGVNKELKQIRGEKVLEKTIRETNRTRCRWRDRSRVVVPPVVPIYVRIPFVSAVYGYGFVAACKL